MLTKLSSKSIILTYADPNITEAECLFVSGHTHQKNQKLPGTGFTLQTQYWESLGWYDHSGFQSSQDNIGISCLKTRKWTNKLNQTINQRLGAGVGKWMGG